MAKTRDPIARVAKELGYRELRPGQQEAIQALLGSRDTLAVTPTGSGKSAIYQIAGRLIQGPTIVVSPLIALQADQVESLRTARRGGGRGQLDGYHRGAAADFRGPGHRRSRVFVCRT